MWICPDCGRKFSRDNQSHSCLEYNLDDMFIGKDPKTRDLFDYLMVQVTSKIHKDNLTIPIEKNDFNSGKELPLQSCIRLHKIFLLNESLIITKYSSVNQGFLDSVVEKITGLIK